MKGVGKKDSDRGDGVGGCGGAAGGEGDSVGVVYTKKA
jgi:hypothetical protein